MTRMDGMFDGRVAIVCGASRGIGNATAKMIASHGATVILSSRKQEKLEAAARCINTTYPGHAIAIPANAGRAQDLESLVARTMEQCGRIDLLVYSAGSSPELGPLVDSTAAAWQKAFEVNVLGALTLVRLAVRAWMGEHGGSIVTVASLGALRPRPNFGIYTTTKAALIMLTKQLAKELGAQRIRVNAVAPGVIKTDFSSTLWTDQARMAQILQDNPLGRIGTPDEVAATIVFLLSDAAGFVNGHTVVIDGGTTGVT